MRLKRILSLTCVAILLTITLSSQLQHRTTFAQSAESAKAGDVAVAPQYDTTHVYVPVADFDRFVTSVLQTFGGKTSQEGVFTVTPTPSSTRPSPCDSGRPGWSAFFTTTGATCQNLALLKVNSR